MDIVISQTDILAAKADLIVLKYADAFHGADGAVARAIEFNGHLSPGQTRLLPGKGIAASWVLFIGVGPLHEFRYGQIQEFGALAVQHASSSFRAAVSHIALTIHGPGYGLDTEQAFLAMLAGIVQEKARTGVPLKRVTIAERSQSRFDLLNSILLERGHEFGLAPGSDPHSFKTGGSTPDVPERVSAEIIDFGERAEHKPKLFIAMPFAEDFIDEYEIGFCEAGKANGYVCERLDVAAFTGDIVVEMQRRILSSHGVIALLNGGNPNVFLEVGFALAHNKPIVLVADESEQIPFDVRGHRCVRYRSITKLREALTQEIGALKAQGVLIKSA
jgi:hypothetical protein